MRNVKRSVQTPRGTSAASSTYRVLVSQSSGADGVFSSDFLSALSSDFNNGTNSSSGDTATYFNRTYAGTTVPVDVYSVSSNVNASTLCSALTSTNSGTFRLVSALVTPWSFNQPHMRPEGAANSDYDCVGLCRCQLL